MSITASFAPFSGYLPQNSPPPPCAKVSTCSKSGKGGSGVFVEVLVGVIVGVKVDVFVGVLVRVWVGVTEGVLEGEDVGEGDSVGVNSVGVGRG